MAIPTETNESVDLLTFSLGAITLCVPIDSVLSILQPERIIAVPNPQPAINGLIDYQDELVPLIDLAFLLGFPTIQAEYVIVLEFHGNRVAVAVKNVESVIRESILNIMSQGRGECEIERRYVRASVKTHENLPVLNVAAIVENLGSIS